MPTSTFPGWWDSTTLEELLDAARDGATWAELAKIAGGNGPPVKFRAWVTRWKAEAPDRPQTQIARAIAAYSPAGSQEVAELAMVHDVLRKHNSVCECGRPKDPNDRSCADCAIMETHNKRRATI